MGENNMDRDRLSKDLKMLNAVALANIAIWTIGLIALVFILQKGGNTKGLFVILVSGMAVGIQILTRISKLKKNNDENETHMDNMK